jgi:phage gp45-like
MMLLRGIVSSITDAAAAFVRVTGMARSGEVVKNRDVLQHYGFSSRPLEGAACVCVQDGESIVMIADDDRRYRISLANGEVALYDDLGSKIHLKRDRKIEISCGDAVNSGEVTIIANGVAGAIKVVAPSVVLGSASQLTVAAGVVTGMCSCAMTGAPHPVVSQSVKATML